MTFAGPLALQTLGLLAAGLGGLAVLAYVLKMRRRRFEVPFSKLWQRVLREQESTSLWRRLRRFLSLLLQLAMLALLLFAVADPRTGAAPARARDVVIIIDASASMQAHDEGADGDEPRMAAARRRAHELVASLGGGDAAMVLRMDGQATPLSRFEADTPLLHRVIDSIEATDTPADLPRALAAAADALRDRKNPLIVLVGDGAYPAAALVGAVWEPAPAGTPPDERRLDTVDLSGIDVRYLPVGRRGDNVGVIAFNVRRYVANKASYEVFLELENFSELQARVRLTLFSGDAPVDVKELEIPAGQRTRQIYPNLGGGDDHRLRAVLELLPPPSPDKYLAHDVFPLDDVAYALLPERRRQHVLLVTTDNLYLEGAMLVYDNIVVDKLTPADYATRVAAPDFPAYDAVVFDDVTPEQMPPSGHLVYFNPQGDHSPFPIAGSLDRPRVTEVADHPVMRWVTMSDVNFDRTSVFRLDSGRGEVALATSVRAPIIAARRTTSRKVVAFGFPLSGTDLTLRVAFPLLLVNTLDWFAGDDADLVTTYPTGRRLRVPLDGAADIHEVELRGPDGRTVVAPVSDGRANVYAGKVGFHTLVARQHGEVVARAELAANLGNPDESRVAPVAQLALGGRTLDPPGTFAITRHRTLHVYLALGALGLLLLEWLAYNRRWTV